MLYRFGDFELDPGRFQLLRQGQSVPVTRQVFELILALVRGRDRPVTRDELLQLVWDGRRVSDTSLSRCVSEARKLLGDHPRHQRMIKTLHGRGYWFVAEVTEVFEEREPQQQEPQTRWPFVGRAHELELTMPLLHRAVDGSGGMLLLTGEAGIGKTRMMQEISRHGAELGFLVALGSCREVADAPPAWPWVAILRTLQRAFRLRSAPGEAGLAYESVVAFVPELESSQARLPRPPPEDARAAQLRFFDDVTVLLRACALERPLLLCFDDLHRADRLSLQLLRFAVRDLPGLSTMVVGTRREPDPENEPSPPELGTMARESCTTVVPLPKLSRDEALELIDASDVNIETARTRGALFDRSGGNPFFLVQLLSLPEIVGRFERGEHGSHAWLPQTMRDSILTQIMGLPERCRHLLGAAAACGRTFAIRTVAASADATTQETLAGLQPALESGVLEGTDAPAELRFSHVLLQDVLYRELPAAARNRHHLRIMESLAAQHGPEPGPHSSQLAHHARSAWPLGSLDAAVSQAVAAASWATEHLAFDEAATHCRSALDLLAQQVTESDHRTFDILLDLAAAQLRAGLRTEGRETLLKVYGMAGRLGLGERIADVALTIAPGFFSIETGVVDRLLIATLEEALEALGPVPTATRVSLLCQLAIALYWADPGTRREALVCEAEAAAAVVDDPESWAQVRLARFAALWGPDTFGERVAMLETLPKSPSRDGVVALMAVVFRIATRLEMGDVRSVEVEINGFAQLTDLVKDPHPRWYLPMLRGMKALMHGRFEIAKHVAVSFAEMGGRFGDVNVAHSFSAHLCEVLWNSGKADAAIRAAESLVDEYPTVPEWEAILAFLRAESGDLAGAQDCLPRASSFLAPGSPRRINWTIAACALSEVQVFVRDLEGASNLLPLLREMSDRYAVAGYGSVCWGPVSRFVGRLAMVLERWDEAEAAYAHAIDQSRLAGAPAWTAHATLAYAQLCAVRGRSGDPAKSRELAARARSLAEKTGMEKVERLAGRLCLP